MAPIRPPSPSSRRNNVRPNSSFLGRRNNHRSPLSVLTDPYSFNACVKPYRARNVIDFKTRPIPSRNAHHRHPAARRRHLEYSPREHKPLKHTRFSGKLGFRATGRDTAHMKCFDRQAFRLLRSIEKVNNELFTLSVPVSLMHARAMYITDIHSGQSDS
jgi:hypothetical protein